MALVMQFTHLMRSDWLSELERRTTWLVVTYGDRALAAAILGCCFFAGVTMSALALVWCRRALSAWARRWRAAGAIAEQAMEPRLVIAAQPRPLPPPLPTRWLN